MRYAIAADADQVSPHFGRCERYELVDVDDGQVVARGALANPGHEPGLLPRLLKESGVQVLVCGGAGPRAVNLLAELGIGMFAGVSGNVEDAVAAILRGELIGGESTCEH